MAGFGFSETMSGTWSPIDRPDQRRPFRFSLEARSGPLGRFRTDKVVDVNGTLDAEGLATDRAVRGTMIVAPFLRRLIRYELAFTGDDGKPYRFAGQKDIRWLEPVRTWTELPGEITGGNGATVGRAEVRFDLRRDSLAFLRSFRPA
jgi:hypothetical protein